MAATLDALVTRLRANVPQYGDVPTEAQYAQAVQDAVDDLSARLPIIRTTTLEMVAGQASYTLPDDFLRLIALLAPDAQGGAVVTDAGIVPMGLTSQIEETRDIDGLTLTITPTPAYAHARKLRYAARHLLTGASAPAYQTLTAQLATVALYQAQHIALSWQAQKAAQDAWRYTEAEQSVDKSKQADAFRTQSADAHQRYLEALEALQQPVAGRAAPTAGDRAYLETL